jgi:ribosome-associated protein
MLIINQRIAIPLDELHFSYARSSGPGGQNVNKVNSKAILHWNVTTSPSLPEAVRRRMLEQQKTRINNDGELLITSERHRDLSLNKQDCLEKLSTMLKKAASPPRVRRRTKPTKASRQRRLNNKKAVGEKKARRREKFD